MFISVIFVNQKVVNFNKLSKKWSSLLWYFHFRVFTCLQNPWISGVQFKCLESTWNWFWFLNVLDLFIKQNQKISTLISFWSKWKQMFRYTENNILEMLTKCVKTLALFIPIVLLLLSCMSIEPLMHSGCLVCMWFQALVVWCFCMCTCLCPKHSFQHKHFAK